MTDGDALSIWDQFIRGVMSAYVAHGPVWLARHGIGRELLAAALQRRVRFERPGVAGGKLALQPGPIGSGTRLCTFNPARR